MSMPGFVFYFRCDVCDVNSDEYSAFPFHDIFRPDISLPAWSLVHKCWSEIQLSLTREQRTQLESDPQAMSNFAASLSTQALTVGVPRLQLDMSDYAVVVTPPCICPYCGNGCCTVFGYPPCEGLLSSVEIAPEELNSTPVSAIDLSVRSRNICFALGICTLGQLRNRRDEFVGHHGATDDSVAEIDRWLAVGQKSEKATSIP